ncbi:MAG: hypothetical protein KAH72_01755 [Flavobacteriaceae bacterium]|nr:hypothetical protein [Flavobacteriaceae bacterium]
MEKDLELYSDSKRNLKTVDVFIYDEVPDKFKNNIFYFIQGNLNNIELSRIYRDIIKEHGLKRNISETHLTEPNIFIEYLVNGFEKLIDSEDNIDFYLDLIALFLNIKDDDKKEIIVSLNKILYKYSLGYQIDIVKDQIIRVDSKYVHKETIQKVFLLLNDIQFENVDDEYRKAFEELKNGNYEGVLVEANKAFESTMKIICELKGYGLPTKHTASALIAHLKKNDFIENFQTDKFNGLAKTLESVSMMRNHQAGHGQGVKKRELSSIFAEYALQVTASNILLLIGIYNESI